MVSKIGAVLSGRIRDELSELAMVVDRAEQGWRRAKTQHDDFYLDGVALNLHSFYSGLEHVFEKIASLVDESIPTGANWHQELLRQMNIEVPGVRPAVISAELRTELEEYRGFRHIVRNVYTYQLNPEKLERLITMLRETLSRTERELLAFAKFLESAE
ncbi:MAG: hypothetical protein JRI94_19630 [Deltaproteobacteria bacterium]|nr:hypothetical protein [Deltaproteobacteria bacterium]